MQLACCFIFGGSTQAQEWDLRICAAANSLPYSSRDGRGFEPEIAGIVAEELNARPVYVWLPRPSPRVRNILVQQGECDLVMGINDGNPNYLTSVAYYRSSYVFIYREDSPFTLQSLDDPVLEELRVGVQSAGRGVSAPTLALANRGLLDQQVGFEPDYGEEEPLANLVEAVVAGEVDVAMDWGPTAGYFAARQSTPLVIVPVTPQIDRPFVPMVSSISIGVRQGDEALRDGINMALARSWDEIQAILREYDVTLVPLPAPTVGGD